MLKALISASIIASVTFQSLVTQAGTAWTFIGTTNEKEKLFLDVNSAHYVSDEHYVSFTYKIGNNVETTRINTAVSNACQGSTLNSDSRYHYWIVASSNYSSSQVTVKADSNGSLNLLKKACKQAEDMYTRYGTLID